MSRKLITKSADRLLQRGFRQITSHNDQIDRGTGVNYTLFEYRGETFTVRAKEYVFQGKAPFGVEQVNHSLQEDHTLLIYFDDRGKFYAFDPSHVWDEGERTEGRSKRSTSRSWIEVPLSEGVVLSEYLDGVEPAGRSKGDDGYDRSLGEWT